MIERCRQAMLFAMVLGLTACGGGGGRGGGSDAGAGGDGSSDAGGGGDGSSDAGAGGDGSSDASGDGGDGGGAPAEAPADRFVVSGNSDGTISVLRVDPIAGFAHAVGFLNASDSPARDMIVDADNERAVLLTSSFIDTIGFDPATGQVASLDTRNTSGFSSHLVLNADRTVAYVASGTTSGSIDVYAIDADGSLGPNAPVATSIDPDYIVIDPAGERLYVVSRTDDSIEVHDIDADGSLAADPATLDSGENPTALLFGAAGDVAYLTSARSSGDTLEVLDVEADGSLTERAFFDVGNSPIDLVMAAGGDHLYVLDGNGDDVYHFAVDADGALSEVGSHSLGFTPTDLTLSSTGRQLYISHSEESLVSTIAVDPDDGTLTVMDRARVFDGAHTVAAIGGNGALVPSATFLLVPDRDGLSRYAIGPGGGLTLQDVESAEHALIDGEVVVDYDEGLLLATGTNADGADLLVSYDFDTVTGVTAFNQSRDATVDGDSNFQRIELGRAGGFMYVLDADQLGDGNTGFVRVHGYDEAGDVDAQSSQGSTDEAPENQALHPAGRYLYAVNSFGDSIERFEIDKLTGAVTRRGRTAPGPVGSGAGRPVEMVFHPNGRLAYISLEDESEILRYVVDDDGTLDDLRRFNLAASNGGTDTEPGPVAMHPSGLYLFAGERDTDTNIVVLSIDPDAQYSLAFEARVAVTGNPTAVAVDPRGEFLYARYADETVEVFGFDPDTGELSSTGPTVDAGSSGGFLGTLTLVAPLL